jgi:DNA topoisomerase I
MSKTLVIVEAPGKLAKFQKALGDDYIVKASVGHIWELPPEELSIDLDTFTPYYRITKENKKKKTSGKHDVVNELKKQYDKCDNVLLATDDDTEGAFIAWSLAQELKINNPQRIIFHDTTEKAVKGALLKPQNIDMNRVHSQETRRILDRIIGYKLSPLLWGCLEGAKSAGRVQSVVVRFIIERENEIIKFFEGENHSFYKITGLFDDVYKAQLFTSKYQDEKLNDEDYDDVDENNNKQKKSLKKDQPNEINSINSKFKIAKIIKENSARDILKKIGLSVFKVSDVINKNSTRNPSAPFTTDTIIQDAHRKLGFTTQRTTKALQNLYNAGHITYIRTDSTLLADDALKSIGKYIISEYGNQYHNQYQYIPKGGNIQGAHEAIRPTDIKIQIINIKDKCGNDEMILYSLIWKRTVVSQMSAAKFNIVNVEIDIDKLDDYKFIFSHEDIIFDGFLTVYNNIDKDDDLEDNLKNKIIVPKKGKLMSISKTTATQEYKKPPCRFDDSSLIGRIKKLGIGRPSTYNSIIEKIINAEYITIKNNPGIKRDSITLKLLNNGTIKEDIKEIILGKDQKKCVPTEMGNKVTAFLLLHFPQIMDYKFTANMENELDEVANGNIKKNTMLKKFYDTFRPLIENISSNMKDIKISMKESKEIGIHPDSGFKIIGMNGKWGPYLELMNGTKIINKAPIKEPLTLETITIQDAVKLFEFPIELGKHDKKEITLYKGEYGFYIKHGKSGKGISLNIDKNDDKNAKKYTLNMAIEKIDEKKKQNLWEGKDENNNYLILEGPYGKYIKVQPIKKTKKAFNCKIPENTDLDKINIEIMQNIIKKSYGSKFNKKDDEKKKDISEKKIKKDIPEKIKKDISEKKIKKDISEKKIKKDISEKKIKKDIPEKKVKDISEKKIKKDIPEKKVKDISGKKIKDISEKKKGISDKK